MTDINDGQNVQFISGGEGASSLAIVDAELTGLFDYDVTGDGNLTVTMNTVESTGAGGATLDVTGDGSGTLTMNDVDTAGAYAYTGSGGGAVTVSMTDVTGTGGVSQNMSGDGDGALTMTNVDMAGTGDFDFDVSGDGDLTVNMTDITGTGDLTLDVAGAGSGSVTADNVETGGNALAANGTAASSGDINFSVTDSGDAIGGAFTSVVVNQQGSGTVLATFDDVIADSGIDFDSASDTLGSLSVIDGDYAAGIDADDTGDGDLTVSLTNVNADGAVTVNETGDGNATLTMSGGNFTGGVTVTEAGEGNVTTSLTNVDAQGGVSVTEANDGNATLTMSGGTYTAGITFLESGDGDTNVSLSNVDADGAVDFDASGAGNNSFAVNGGTYGGSITADVAAGSTGSFAASVTNGTTFTTGSQIVFNAQNSGTVDFEISSLDPSFNTGANVAAFDLTLGSSISTGDISITNNTGVQTLDAAALDLSIGSGTVDFLLTGNTFSNSSATETVFIDHDGTELNATIQSNALTNSGGGTELLLDNSAASRTNLAVSGNGPAGADYDFVNNTGSALDFNVDGVDSATVDSANAGNVTFTGLFNFDPNLIVPTP